MRGFLKSVMMQRQLDHEQMLSTTPPSKLSNMRNGKSGKKVDIDVEESIKKMRLEHPEASIVHIANVHHVSQPVVRRVLGIRAVDREAKS